MTSSYLLLGVSAVILLTACGEEDLPARPPVDKVIWLEQNWNAEQRQWFNHANQGAQTFFIPYEWFIALEQPGLNLLSDAGLLSDTDYLAKLGFIPGEVGPHNPAGLPVGFAMDPEAVNPVTGVASTGLGLTCAACHTGHMTYKGTSIRYSGGPGMISADKLMAVLFRSMFETQFNHRQFGRFANRVLGEDHRPEQRAELKRQYSKTFMKIIKGAFAGFKAQSEAIILADINNDRESELLRNIAETVKNNLSPKEGFARIDALNRIGNQVFAVDAGKPHNFAAMNAAVSYPAIWSSSWFYWVQYDASIMQPMVRNTGEALGVAAPVNLNGADSSRFASAVRMENLYEIESLLAGPSAFAAGTFGGLRAPQWPESILGEIDQDKAQAGEKLYKTHCQHCHLPPVNSEAFWSERYWSATNLAGDRLLDLVLVPIDEIGTDPYQASVLVNRTVDTTGMGLDTQVLVGDECEPMQIKDGNEVSFAFALGALVQETMDHWYRANGTPEQQQQAMNGHLPNCLRTTMAYKARPLDGVWATAPYLHNGSVPNLYSLLSPYEERPQRFYVGNLEFDPVKVGYRAEEQSGLSLLDTGKPGNANTGHLFMNAAGKGTIGPKLSEDERFALIEFLKTI